MAGDKKQKAGAAGGTAFTDTAGDEWDVRLSVHHVIVVQKATGIDLVGLKPAKDSPGQAEKLAQLLADMGQFMLVLYATVRPQADARGLSEDDFAGRFDLDTYRRAGSAFLRAFMTLYLQGDERRKALAILARQERLMGEQFDAASARAVAALGKLADDGPPASAGPTGQGE